MPNHHLQVDYRSETRCGASVTDVRKPGLARIINLFNTLSRRVRSFVVGTGRAPSVRPFSFPHHPAASGTVLSKQSPEGIVS